MKKQVSLLESENVPVIKNRLTDIPKKYNAWCKDVNDWYTNGVVACKEEFAPIGIKPSKWEHNKSIFDKIQTIFDWVYKTGKKIVKREYYYNKYTETNLTKVISEDGDYEYFDSCYANHIEYFAVEKEAKAIDYTNNIYRKKVCGYSEGFFATGMVKSMVEQDKLERIE